MNEKQHIFNIPGIFTEHISSRKELSILSEKVHKYFSSEEEYCYYLTHHVNNVVHHDGRIYMKLEKDGTLYANSVSPYAEKFLDNIEEKIKHLVSVLHNKRYLTYSSCEGHGYTFRRYVGIAFADQESRNYVKNYIEGLNIKGIRCQEYCSVSNQEIKANTSSKEKIVYEQKLFKEKGLTSNSIEQITINDKEIKTFNIQFHRNYENYYFLEIIILDEVPYDRNFFQHPIKNLWLIYMKKFYWDDITTQLAKQLDNASFKKYPY